MESSGPSANASDHPPHRWADFLGTVIAVLTLTLPMFVIAYYSSNGNTEPLPTSNYSQPRAEN